MADLPITTLTSLQIQSPIDTFGNPTDTTYGQGGLYAGQMTTEQRNALGKNQKGGVPNGTIVYDTDLGSFALYQNGGWVEGAGNVTGPDVSTAGRICIFTDDTGTVIGDSGVAINQVQPPQFRLASKFANDDIISLQGIGEINFANNLGFITVNGEQGNKLFMTLSLGTSELNPTQNIWISDDTSSDFPYPSALLQLSSTQGALLVSRMTTEQINNIIGENNRSGMIAYATDTNELMMCLDGTWVAVGQKGSTGSGTVTEVEISTTTNGLNITGSPITESGNIIINLDPQLQTLSQLSTTGVAELQGLSQSSSTGLVTRTGAGTYIENSIAVGSTNNLTITHASGVGGNPTLDLSPTLSGLTSVETNSIILPNNSSTVTIQAPSDLGTAYTFTLPPNSGTTNQVLTTDGTGNTSWTSDSGKGWDPNHPGSTTGTDTGGHVIAWGDNSGGKVIDVPVTIDTSGNITMNGILAGVSNIEDNGGGINISSSTSQDINVSSGRNVNVNLNGTMYVNGFSAQSINNAWNSYYDGYHDNNNFSANISIQANKCIYTEDNMIATGSDITSSINIKDILDQGLSIEQEAFDLFNKIPFKKYQYKDKIKHGNGVVYGMIAEEVREVMPHSVTNHKAFIPNIMQCVDITDIYNTDHSFIYKLSFEDKSFALSETIKEGDGVRFKILLTTKETNQEITEEGIIKLIGTDFISVEMQSTFKEGSRIYVYGTYSDCPTINKNNIFELGMVTLQKVIKDQEQKNQELLNRIESLEAKLKQS